MQSSTESTAEVAVPGMALPGVNDPAVALETIPRALTATGFVIPARHGDVAAAATTAATATLSSGNPADPSGSSSSSRSSRAGQDHCSHFRVQAALSPAAPPTDSGSKKLSRASSSVLRKLPSPRGFDDDDDDNDGGSRKNHRPRRSFSCPSRKTAKLATDDSNFSGPGYSSSGGDSKAALLLENAVNNLLSGVIAGFQQGLRAGDYKDGDLAARNGHMHIVTLVATTFSDRAMALAASQGHLEMVAYLHRSRGEGTTTEALDAAATSGHLEVVKFLHENRREGCTTRAMNGAASNNHLHVSIVHYRKSTCFLAIFSGKGKSPRTLWIYCFFPDSSLWERYFLLETLEHHRRDVVLYQVCFSAYKYLPTSGPAVDLLGCGVGSPLPRNRSLHDTPRRRHDQQHTGSNNWSTCTRSPLKKFVNAERPNFRAELQYYDLKSGATANFL